MAKTTRRGALIAAALCIPGEKNIEEESTKMELHEKLLRGWFDFAGIRLNGLKEDIPRGKFIFAGTA